jgi:hypothetical protein
VANPTTPVLAIDAALALGKNLILTPGVYDLNHPILVTRPGTVVLGLGYATLVPQRGNAAMIVVPNVGVKLSGMIIDAGPVNSPVLLSVGIPGLGPVRPLTPTRFRMSSSASAERRRRTFRLTSASSTTPTTPSSMTFGPGALTTATPSAGPRTPLTQASSSLATM